MDEYFHYNQFKKYYEGDYAAWDSKITTPPGLYYLQKIFSFFTGGSLPAMRAISCFIFGNLFAVFAMKIYDFQDYNRNNLMRTLNLIITPTIFFFNFLDYTDSASLALITMSFYYCLVGSVWRMGFSSLLAVCVRQNNIIWAGYLLLYRIIADHSVAIGSIHGNIFKSIFGFIKILFTNRNQIIKKNIGQILIFPLFVWYMYTYNGGRLLFGDHSNHKPTFHPSQLLYLSVFLFINLPMTLADYLHSLKETFNRLYYSRHAFAAYLFLLSACLILVDKFSYVHPFILADNRHYIFYLYRYFKWAKYPLCLVYPFLIIVLVRRIIISQEKLIKFISWACISLVYLMLSELVEFRYYAVPFVMIAFELKNRSMSLDVEKIHGRSDIIGGNNLGIENRMIITTLGKIVINVFVFYMFLFRPFGK